MTCMNFLLNAIKCKDPWLNAVIEMVKDNKGPTRKINKLKDVAAYLTPWDHVSKNHNTNRKLCAS